ncbi:MAG: class IV adenylate cyclase [Spirochaetales bacterium]
MKAWVDDWGKLEKQLRTRFTFNRSFTKRDRYFRSTDPDNAPPGGPTFRLREDGSTSTVTFKTKTIRDGFEFNNEQEFRVDNASAFVSFAHHLGFESDISKVKHGLSFTDHDLHVELVEIEGLGCFLEIEFVHIDQNESLHKEAADRIKSVFESLPVDMNRIEDRPYNQLLREHTAGPASS